MKSGTFLFSVICLLFVFCVVKLNSQNDDKGPLKSIKVFTIPYKNNKPDSAHAYLSSSRTFNERGLVMSFNEWNEKGDKLKSEIYSYDEKGRMIKSDNLFNHLIWVYNSAGNLSEQKELSVTDNKTILSRKRWSYDGQNRIVEEKFFNQNGESTWWVVFNYNGDILKSRRGFHPDMSTYWTEEYSYDSKNRKIAVEFLDNTGLIFRKEGWAYDNNGDTSLTEEYNAAGVVVTKQVRNYYSKGKIKSIETIDDRGNPISTKLYDANGNLTDDLVFDSDGSVLQEKRSTYTSNNIKIKEITVFRGDIFSESNYRIEYLPK